MEAYREISRWKTFLINAGFHCMVLGMGGVLALIFAGFLVISLGLPISIFYAILGTGLIFPESSTVLCLNCNCSNFNSDQD